MGSLDRLLRQEARSELTDGQPIWDWKNMLSSGEHSIRRRARSLSLRVETLEHIQQIPVFGGALSISVRLFELGCPFKRADHIVV
jgi:hypothetical protein